MSDLVAAMEINSPSIYAAFGSKEALFAEAIQRYREHHAAGLLPALNASDDPIQALSAMYEAAIDLFTHEGRPYGCFIVAACAGNAPPTTDVRESLAHLRLERGEEIAARLRRDVVKGRLPATLAIQPLSDMYAAILQGMAIAARDGISRKRLAALYAPAVRMLEVD